MNCRNLTASLLIALLVGIIPSTLLCQEDMKAYHAKDRMQLEKKGPLGQEISETQRAINALEKELARQHDYLDDLYSVQHSRVEKKDAQEARIEELQQQISELTILMGNLTSAVTNLAEKDTLPAPTAYSANKGTDLYTRRDSLELIQLRRLEAESRRQIDDLTMEILKVSQTLKDPNKRYALARKLKENAKNPSKPTATNEPVKVVKIDNISSRAIDMAAVNLVRKGYSLDQSRMIVIDGLPGEQIQEYYKSLPKEKRYELYDIADEIMSRDSVDLPDARRSALFFYFYTQ